MASEGDELVHPATGLRTVFRKTARETSGELLQVDWIGEPGWTTRPDHVHPRQEERFEVISGELGLRVEGIERVYGAGEVMRTEIAFETLAGFARDGKTNSAGAPKTSYCASTRAISSGPRSMSRG
jgi:hypothetical protein